VRVRVCLCAILYVTEHVCMHAYVHTCIVAVCSMHPDWRN